MADEEKLAQIKIKPFYYHTLAIGNTLSKRVRITYKNWQYRIEDETGRLIQVITPEQVLQILHLEGA